MKSAIGVTRYVRMKSVTSTNEICNESSREIKLVTKAAAVHDMKFIVNVGSAME